MPDRPTGLKGDAKKAWDRLSPVMNRVGLLTEADADGLESYCRVYALARRCWKKADEDGPIVNLGGKPEINPYLREARQAETLLHKLRSELGLNATSRSRIAVKPTEREEDFEGFLKFVQDAA